MKTESMEVIYSTGSILGGGGIGDYAYYAVKGIYRHGLLKEVLVLDYKTTEIQNNKIRKVIPFGKLIDLALGGVRHYISTRLPTYEIEDNLFDYLAARHITKADIFHGWNHLSLFQIRKAKTYGMKTIVERTSSHPLTQNKLLTDEYKKYGIPYAPISEWILKKCLKEFEEADYVTIPSDFVRDSFEEHDFDMEKVIQIPSGVDVEKFKPIEKRNGEVFRAIFVGSVQLRKGVQYLLEAWDSLGLKNAELLVCGVIHDDMKNIVRKYRQNKSIKFLGYVSPIPYEKADIFVFPSIEEGSAKVTYEAMACGLPVIVTHNTGSVARNGKDGFVIPIRSVESLKEKIRYFYENQKEVKTMGRNARKHVENYTWERYGNELVKRYKEMV